MQERKVSKITATIDAENSGNVQIMVAYDDESVEKKNLPLLTFSNLFRHAIEDSGDVQKVSRVGRLPGGFLDGGYDAEAQIMEAVIYVPGDIRPIRYYGKAYFVPFPNMVFKFQTKKGKVVISQVFAVEGDPRQGEPAKLCRYPFGNVYDNGKICWGRNTLPQITEMREFDFLVSMFFGSETNDDLYQGVKVVHEGKSVDLDQRSLLEMLKGKKEFPGQILLPAGSTEKLVADL